METNDKEYATHDMYLSACFMVEGIKFLRAEQEDGSRRLKFIFENIPDIERIKSERANGTHVVSSVNYDECTRRLKGIVHGG